MSAVLAAKVTNRADPSPNAAPAAIATIDWPPGFGRAQAVLDGEQGQPDEQDAEQDRHGGHRVGRVLRLRRLERRDAVGDGLDAGQRDRAAGEGLEQEQDADRLEVVRGGKGTASGSGRDLDDGPADDVDQADRDDPQGQADEQVGRDREDVAGLAQAAQVGDRDERDRDERDLDPEVVGGRDDRLDLGDRGGRRDRDGHDVVDEQRRGGDEPEDRGQVGLGHDVGAAAVRVGAADLPVRDGHDGEQDRDRDRHLERQEQRARRRPGPGRAGSPRSRRRTS